MNHVIIAMNLLGRQNLVLFTDSEVKRGKWARKSIKKGQSSSLNFHKKSQIAPLNDSQTHTHKTMNCSGSWSVIMTFGWVWKKIFFFRRWLFIVHWKWRENWWKLMRKISEFSPSRNFFLLKSKKSLSTVITELSEG